MLPLLPLLLLLLLFVPPQEEKGGGESLMAFSPPREATGENEVEPIEEVACLGLTTLPLLGSIPNIPALYAPLEGSGPSMPAPPDAPNGMLGGGMDGRGGAAVGAADEGGGGGASPEPVTALRVGI